MAQPFETLREVGVALDGFRDDVRGQFTTLKWIIGGISVVGLAVAGILFNKVDSLEVIAARNTAILERIEASVRDVASNTNDIKESVQAASAAEPSSASIVGWRAIPLSDYGNIEEFNEALIKEINAAFRESGQLENVWIYFPNPDAASGD